MSSSKTVKDRHCASMSGAETDGLGMLRWQDDWHLVMRALVSHRQPCS